MRNILRQDSPGLLRFRFARRDLSTAKPAPRMAMRPRTGYAVVIVGGGLHGLGAAQALADRHGIGDVAVLDADGVLRDTAPALLRLEDAAPAMLELYGTAASRWRRLMVRHGRRRRRSAGHIVLAHGEAVATWLRFQTSVAAAAGVRRRTLDRDDLRRRCPGLNLFADTHLAVLEAAHQSDAAVLPVADALRRAARFVVGRGVQLLSGVAPIRLRANAGRIVGIETSHGILHADRVLLTAPMVTARLAAGAGLALPLALERIDRAATLPVAPWLAPSVASEALGIELWQGEDGTVTIMGVDAATRAVALFPALAAATVATLQQAVRERTPDGLPLLGSCGMDGLLVNAGWAGATAWSAPVVAEMLADAVVGDARAAAAVAFAPARFAGRAAIAAA